MLPYSGHYDVLGEKLTADELVLLITNFWSIPDVIRCRNVVIETTTNNYPTSSGDGMMGNAFQHAYWTMLMYYNISPSFSIDFAVAHEAYDGNSPLHKTNSTVPYNIPEPRYIYRSDNIEFQGIQETEIEK